MSTITITASSLNVRATPSTDAAVLAQLARDATVEKVGASPDGEWFQVRTPAGTSGWIAAKYAVESAAPAAPPAPATLSINADRLNVRATPSTGAAVLAQLARGATVQKLDASPDGQWFQVSAAGVTGWISAQYAVPVPAGASASAPIVSAPTQPAAAGSTAGTAAAGGLAGETLAYRCLALTAGFETEVMPPECFAGLAGDFDGQAMSFGVLQWNLGQGTLQPLLQQIDRESPSVVQAVMGDGYAEFRAFLAKPKADQMAWARGKQSSNKWQDPWRSRFKALGRTAEMQKIQVAGAGDRYQKGLALVQAYGLWSERAAALMFDIVVQNGSIKDATKQQILADFARIDGSLPKADQEVLKMRAVANRRAEAASAKFVEDVRSRKLTIANGSGTVHGDKYDLEKTYGIRLVPIA
ncbi:MAG: peptidoglycan-binding domain 1 protein [Gemmatimonadetes bacterium]|nr:peptidoglycan-binding domain 1 protein [Gemmatimonadota bacterium]